MHEISKITHSQGYNSFLILHIVKNTLDFYIKHSQGYTIFLRLHIDKATLYF